MNEQKYKLNSKRYRERIIKNWIIAVIVAAIIIWAFAGMPALELKSKSIEILKSIFKGLFLSLIHISEPTRPY